MLYFILGGLAYGFAIPIIEQLGSLILCLIEYLKAKVSLKLSSVNKEIQDIVNQTEGYPAHAIGFQVNTEEDYIDEEYDDE